MNDLLETALAGAIAHTGPRARAWLSRCAEWSGPLPAEMHASDGDLDQLLDTVWRSRSDEQRASLGAVFTPRNVAKQLLLELYDSSDPTGLLDPACGGGIFLMEAARLCAARERSRGRSPIEIARKVLAEIHGIDIDADTVRLARLLLGREVIHLLGEDAETIIDDLPLPSVCCRDAMEAGALDRYRGHVNAVVGNPPYREAKGMDKTYRDSLRARFGDSLCGAFDIYLCFLLLGLELVGAQGHVGLVLPNKFLVARYAELLRTSLSEGQRLRTLLDLSELDVFGQVGVYPMIVVLGPAQHSFKACFAVTAAEHLGREPLPGLSVPNSLPLRVRHPPVWFVPPNEVLCSLIERLTSWERLSMHVRVRSACSFHEKGLRERYISSSKELPDGIPYLGGQSFNRRNEIQPYRVAWQGFRIRYDEEELRAAGNPLPPLDCFQQPKLVICQHARSTIAWFDEGGRFITKDVYPIVLSLSRDPDLVAAMAALFNSRIFSVLYAILYRGIAIGGGYLHFLPVSLHNMPVPSFSPAERAALAGQVRALQSQPSPARAAQLDDEITEFYQLTAAERDAVHIHAKRIGFGEDLLSRR